MMLSGVVRVPLRWSEFSPTNALFRRRHLGQEAVINLTHGLYASLLYGFSPIRSMYGFSVYMLLEDKSHSQGPKEKNRFSSSLPMKISTSRRKQRSKDRERYARARKVKSCVMREE